jgi:serine/threonine protein phosphatase 1
MSIYACSDLHGRYDLYLQIKEFLNPEDKVYFLGDAGDRGPDGWKLITSIYEDPQFIYIKGNHEDMLYNAMYDYFYEDLEGENIYLLCYCNGGYNTFESWKLLPRDEQIEWANKINNLPTFKQITTKLNTNIYLSHAGFFYHDNLETCIKEQDFLWNRKHIATTGNLGNNSLMIHGHTPVQHINGFLGNKIKESFDNNMVGAFWYNDMNKVCIDCGSAFSNYTVLLDLDTFDEHIFQCGEINLF